MRLVAIASGAVALALGITLVFLNPFAVLASGIDTSLRFRVRPPQAAMRIIATAPLSGVGIDQYQFLYDNLAPAELLRLDPRRNNAHNYLLWLTAELGVVGALTFMWLLVSAGFESVRNFQKWPSRSRQLAVAGVAAFVITWSIGQPTSIPAAAYLFWLALGITTAPESTSADVRANASRGQIPLVWVGLLLFGVVMAATLPARVALASRSTFPACDGASRTRVETTRRDESGGPDLMPPSFSVLPLPPWTCGWRRRCPRHRRA